MQELYKAYSKELIEAIIIEILEIKTFTGKN
jgi:hypothetical protein